MLVAGQLNRSEIGEPVYLAGNSLGGFVAASIATHHPELCRGVRYLLRRLQSGQAGAACQTTAVVPQHVTEQGPLHCRLSS
jgi:pimeloyl-ACP methyl ester carboxylesterase